MIQTKDIVFICDDNYCLPTAVCIQSIIDYMEGKGGLTIHVCTFGLSEDNRNLINRLNNYSNDIRIAIDLFIKSDYENVLANVNQKSHVTPTALIKFELANYFNSIDTLLYLDSDIIIKGDISSLLQIDISDYYLAASYEFWEHLRRIRYTLNRTVSKNFYFNSGVMLLNLRKLREDNIPDELWCYKIYKAKTRLMDQESLNVVCGSAVKPLSVIWNYNPIFFEDYYVKELNKVYGEQFENAAEAEEATRIIHFVGKADKPWVYEGSRKRNYWDRAYAQLGTERTVELKKYVAEKRTKKQALKEKIFNNGLWGAICFILNRITHRHNRLYL